MSRRRRRTADARTADVRTADARVADGFENVAARIGLGQRNLLAASGYARTRGLGVGELEEMYRTSWVVGRMVEVVAEDMVRAGISIQSQLPPDRIDALHRAWQAVGIPGRLADAIKWARLYGGAIAVLLVDGQDLEAPLDLDAIGQGDFRGLAVLDRHQVTPGDRTIDELGPMLGYPASYRVHDVDGLATGQNIHHSRVLRFIGIELPHRQRRGEQGWGASVVERVLDRILALDSSTYGAANLMLKSHLRVVRVKDLRRILAQGGPAETALIKMMSMIGEVQSNEGLTLLDGDDEFAAHSWTFAGVYDALQAFAEQIAGATGIPLVRLLGQAPKGFGSGDSDLQTYYETILTAQEDDLRGAVSLLLAVLSRSLWGEASADLAFQFNPLAAPGAVEKSQIATADAQAVAALFSAGLIDEAQALVELRDTGRLTGRFAHIRDEDIARARADGTAPPIDEAVPEPGAEPVPEPGPELGPEPGARSPERAR